MTKSTTEKPPVPLQPLSVRRRLVEKTHGCSPKPKACLSVGATGRFEGSVPHGRGPTSGVKEDGRHLFTVSSGCGRSKLRQTDAQPRDSISKDRCLRVGRKPAENAVNSSGAAPKRGRHGIPTDASGVEQVFTAPSSPLRRPPFPAPAPVSHVFSSVLSRHNSENAFAP